MAVIPKEQIESVEPWKITSFDAPAASRKPTQEKAAPNNPSKPAHPSVSGVPLPTAESIEKVHEEARKQGYQEGLASGEKAGYESGIKNIQQEAEKLALLANNFEQALASLDQEVADAVLQLGISIAKQIVQHQLEAQPEFITDVIRSALNSLPIHHGNLNITVHPEDGRLLREQLGSQIVQSGWHLIDDSSIERGGCLIRAGGCEIDASFATRWRRVLEMLGKTSDKPQ